jgi:hypothetical protein
MMAERAHQAKAVQPAVCDRKLANRAKACMPRAHSFSGIRFSGSPTLKPAGITAVLVAVRCAFCRAVGGQCFIFG